MSCSMNEASRFGRMLNVIFRTTMAWFNDEELFDKQCKNHPGFTTRCRNAAQNDASVTQVEYAQYRFLVFKWHSKMLSTCIEGLRSEDYVQIRNTLILLQRLVPYFPLVHKLHDSLKFQLEAVANIEKSARPDLYALTVGFLSILKMQEKQLVDQVTFTGTWDLSELDAKREDSQESVKSVKHSKPEKERKRSKKSDSKTKRRLKREKKSRSKREKSLSSNSDEKKRSRNKRSLDETE